MENNIEKIVIGLLNSEGFLPSGWLASSDIPQEKNDYFVQVERTGGPVNDVRIEQPELLISFFHKNSAEKASETAIATDIKLRKEILKIKNISRVQRLSLVRLDDTVIKYRRYQAYYSFVLHV